MESEKQKSAQPQAAANGGSRKGNKGKWYNASLQHGSTKHNKKRKDLGRAEWSRQPFDRRAANDERNAKRQKREEEGGEGTFKSVLPAPFSQEEIAAEERRPKHKVAVMIGYSGSGYRGMQINTTEKTIEGDLFAAFVAAGAISKANANDPKKSNLVRCARTDKGVHAAGNVISLKLIIEDADIVAKINEKLSPQIRVWGIQRTIGSFSCYQACDSRWYEYLIPTHSFLPPHPDSQLAKKLRELAEEAGDLSGYEERQEEVKNFWAQTDEQYIQPVLESLDDSVRGVAVKEFHAAEEDLSNNEEAETAKVVEASMEPADAESVKVKQAEQRKKVDAATRQLRQAYLSAKKAYRIPSERLARVENALELFLGTNKYHNYTVMKSFNDSSCKRVIKSFTTTHSKPIIINGTEWLSLKIHGQSFMMHQIRKMVGMIALVVRCGCPLSRITESFGDVNVSIPKVPGLGLLLERPVFQSYNEGAAVKFEREPILFEKFEEEMNAFKQREIYERIFREEEQGNAFHTFFAQVDAHTQGQFLYLSSLGVDAVKKYAKHGRGVVGSGTGANGKTASRASNAALDSEDEDELEVGRRGEGDG